MNTGDADVIYRPSIQDLSWARAFQPDTCLLLGAPSQDLLDRLRPMGLEIRSADAKWAKILHRGTYMLRGEGAWALVIVTQGSETSAAQSADRDADGHLGSVGLIYEDFWKSGRPLSGSARFEVGDYVRPHGGSIIGVVHRNLLHSHGYDVEVQIDGRASTYDEADLELVEGNPQDPEFWVQGDPARAEELAFTLTWTKLRNPLTDTLYSYSSSKTLFRPYQFVPVLKLLGSPSGRLLIADEVGLGKTIEAGLVWSELEQRNPLRRVLVLVPAALTEKWRAEMRRRFDRPVDVLTTAAMRDFADQIRRGEDPALHGVMSLQALRGANDVIEVLQEVNPRFDLVIVDEAHAMRNRGTSTHLLGQFLSDWSDYLVFLSATPLNLGRSDLFNLMNILDQEQFSDERVFETQLEPNRILNDVLRQLAIADQSEPRKLLSRLDEIRTLPLGPAVTERPDFLSLARLLDREEPLDPGERARAKRIIAELNTLSSVFTRTRKVDVPDAKAVRQAVQVDVDWTPEERSFYDGVRKLYMARARARKIPRGFALQMPLRQAASCIPAMQRAMALADFDGVTVMVGDDEDETNVDFNELDASDFQELMGLNRPIAVDSKFEALRDRLSLAREHGMGQAMIFSFFRGTLEYLAEQLEGDFKVRVLTGRTPMIERQLIMEDFRAGRFELLLLSQVGSEGLDFEFCNVLVNYDLPWNPMQVEQRIGRLDRFGQKHEKIFIFNMHIPGTIETDIFERLYHRIGLFRDSIGELEPILRDDLESWTQQMLDPSLTDAQRVRQADRVAVALEAKAQELERLGESSALLSSIDQLAIDGMTESGPTDGRYVGPSEVRRLVMRLLDRLDGALFPPDPEGRHGLIGSTRLADEFSRARLPRLGSMYSPSRLAAMLRDGDRITVTFNTETASRHDIELISSRHPLVLLALNQFGSDSITLKRYGWVGVPGLPPNHRYAVRLDLVTSTGLRPRRELWASAIDLADGRATDQVEAPLLTALAEGTFVDVRPQAIDIPLRELTWLVSMKRRTVRAERAADNEAMVEGRIQSRRRGISLKIQRAEQTLADMRRQSPDKRIIRLHEGRIRNLRRDMEAITTELEQLKALTMSNDPVAVLVVLGI